MSSQSPMRGGGRGLQEVAITLLVFAVALHFLAAELPKVVVPVAILAGVFVVVRLVLHHTRQW
jgi:hypothetical protein